MSHIGFVSFPDLVMEPAHFDPEITEYVVSRPEPNPNRILFKIELAKCDERINYMYDFTGNNKRPISLKEHAENPRVVDIPCYESTIEVLYRPINPYDQETVNEERRYAFRFPKRVVTDLERENCTHPSSHELEGEIWGGASGSCQIEWITFCNFCGQQLGSQIEYHN